jgi:hypothetical protein
MVMMVMGFMVMLMIMVRGAMLRVTMMAMGTAMTIGASLWCEGDLHGLDLCP